MRQLFLFGDVSCNFMSNLRYFVKACADRSCVAVLMMNTESKKYEELYSIPLDELGAEYRFIYPQQGKLREDDIVYLKEKSNGILMAGGIPEIYSSVYVLSEIGDLLRKKYYEGIPYAGVSAGAIMATEFYEDSVIKKSDGKNEVFLASKFNGKIGEYGSKSKGLGLISNIFVEPHFAEWGVFPALIEKMNNYHIRRGIGFDESIGLRIINEEIIDVFGKGRVYIFNKNGKGDFGVKVYEPMDRIIIKKRNEIER